MTHAKRTGILMTAAAAFAAAGSLHGAPTKPPKPNAYPAERHDRATWTERVGGETITVEGTLVPVHEPADGYCARRREGQRARAELRRQLNWGSLSETAKAALHDDAVGPDQVDPEGINLVNFAWAFTKSVRGEDHAASDLALNVDGDVVVIGTDLGNDSDPDGFARFFINELDGTANASQGWTENWERAPYHTGAGADGYITGERGAVDFRGNTYVCGARSDGRFNIWKFDGETGSTLWSKSESVTDGTDAIATDIDVDPEGTVYVSGHYTQNADGSLAWFVARFNPDTGSMDWIVQPPVEGKPSGGIEFDRKGDLFIGGFGTAAHRIAKMRAQDGSLVWTRLVAETEPSTGMIDTLRLDPDGDVYFSSRRDGNDGGWRTSKWNGESGNLIWSKTTTDGQPKNLEVDADGNVYVCGDGDGRTYKLSKYDTDGTLLWTFTTGTTGIATDLALDRLGNPYMAGWFGGGSSNPKVMTTKHDPETGAMVWEMIDSPNRPNEINTSFRPRDLVVDAGGNVYVAGDRSGETTAGGFAEGSEFWVIKYEQPYVSIPKVVRSYPQVSIEHRSVWDPDGSLGIDGFEYSKTLFKLDAKADLDRGQINDRLDAEVDYGAGTVEAGMRLREFSGEVKMTFETEVSGGTFDASTTGELAIAIPGELNATQDFDIVLNWDPADFGTDLLSNIEPQMYAGIFMSTDGHLDADLVIEKGNGDTIADLDIIDWNLTYPRNDTDPPISIIDIDFVNMPPAGIWYSVVKFPWTRFFNGQIRVPQFRSEGAFNESEGKISSSLRTKFFDGKVRLTELVLASFGQAPLSFNFKVPGSGNGYDARIDAGVIQADIDGKVFMLQDLDLELRPYVYLEFASDGDVVPDDVRIDFYDGQGDPVEQRTHTVRLPDNGELTVTPRFGVDATLTNSSGLEFQFVASFDPVRAKASISALGVDVVDYDKCIACTEEPFDLVVRNSSLGIPDISEDFTFPKEHTLAPIQIFGDVNLQPQLIGASRESARMLIYDQRNPTLAEFNAFAAGTTPMVLYGYKFFSGASNQVTISHHGREEHLAKARLNDQAILVEVPNRFFLLPGIARLWVTNNNGVSESIDLAVEYPFPNFHGLEEVYWASDTRWTEQEVVLVDGGTPGGNDTFIARRDYYEYLQNMLWGPDILADLGNPNLTADEYFPDFTGWSVAGVEPTTPGFPALTFDGMSVPRDQDNLLDGKFRVRVPEEGVAMSGFKLLELCNPGPGGGMSRVQQIEVPAPRPVVSGVSPEVFQPGNVEADSQGFVRLSVTGPVTVPFFPGYEEPKYGNFTPRSTVYIDGMAVPTEFISSSELVARVPSVAFNAFGRRRVNVFTPNPTGTRYNEKLITGQGTIANEGLAPSGGVSNTHVIEILWPQPIVSHVSHETITVGDPPIFPVSVDGMPPPDDHNVTLLGENFAPNCRVFLDGVQIPSTRETDSLIRCTLTAADVATIGTAQVWVGNPPPSVRTSDPLSISIVAEVP